MDNVRVPIHVHHYVTSFYTPFEVLNIDYVGPFPDDGHVLVIICAFTRWVELYWCQDATASWACDCLLQHFGRFGSPSLIRSDRGSHFANDLIKEFLDRIGTPHNLTLAYSKQENALVERVNKEVTATSRHSFLNPLTWPVTAHTYRLCNALSMHQYTLARAPPRPVSYLAIQSDWTRVSYYPLPKSPRLLYQPRRKSPT
jgi:transposase InsO family protein